MLITIAMEFILILFNLLLLKKLFFPIDELYIGITFFPD